MAGVRITRNQLNAMDPKDQARGQQLLEHLEKAFQKLRSGFPGDLFPYNRGQLLTGPVEDRLARLRHLLQTGKKLLLSSNRLESIRSRVAPRMLAATLVDDLHPDRYRELEARLRGDKLPHVSLGISSLRPDWIA